MSSAKASIEAKNMTSLEIPPLERLNVADYNSFDNMSTKVVKKSHPF